eukprot:CAMPEP_0183353634 /NCGR_PEP_ID=MMETSP0164_2-20130417/34172_1 /TAXON_ID=221442 /ORGANISM="Coccolithus pelagicus ssp braarudi, Strain PLY182g" /LENGTH=130 /DNA_ID=CAMNT_0025526337 /DNA_START=347 /DNA_END=740 /DNA_ORIENTATION=-
MIAATNTAPASVGTRPMPLLTSSSSFHDSLRNSLGGGPLMFATFWRIDSVVASNASEFCKATAGASATASRVSSFNATGCGALDSAAARFSSEAVPQAQQSHHHCQRWCNKWVEYNADGLAALAVHTSGH